MAYTAPTISGYNATPPSDDGASTSSNRLYWSIIKTKLTDPLKNYVDSINSAISASFSGLFLSSIDDKAVNFTAGTADDGKLFNCTSAITVTLPPASSATEGYHICIFNSSTGTITIDGDGSENINGSANMTLVDRYTAAFLVCTGSGWYAMKFGLSSEGDITVQGKFKNPTDGELTIASGVITATGTYHTIDTEADAASDDLVTINGFVNGMFLDIRAENDARTVVVKHNTGNIYNPSGSDITLDNYYDILTLRYDSVIAKWLVVGCSASQLGVVSTKINNTKRILQHAYKSTTTADSTALNVPDDNTIPQNGECKLGLAADAFTPTSATSKLRISYSAMISNGSASTTGMLLLFKDSNAGAIKISPALVGNGDPTTINGYYEMVAGTTSAITFKLYFGGISSTTYFLSDNGTAKWGGTVMADIRIEEIEA